MDILLEIFAMLKMLFFILLSFTKNLVGHQIFNLGCGRSITLNNLAKILVLNIKKKSHF